ncbi:hypothetical protein BFS30_25435 [Pedobacter steynii]|uniref:Uncharacterized protein n=2 Tax=Pedobacter steynii TaxID=430522 RepID=A0A1D7QNG0_9SPHI|nr:hypothetical protein BFS30_25435 [Pedobacter steynii]
MVGVLLMYSCKEKDLSEPANETLSKKHLYLSRMASKNVIDGRLYFASKEELQTLFDELKEADEETIASYIDATGIASLRPVVTESNEKNIYDKTVSRIGALKENRRFMSSKNASVRLENIEQMIDDIDNLQEIVGDDIYAGLLNSDGEIQIGGDIYKYTDVGLFKVNKENYESLLRYMEKEKIADNMLYKTEEAVQTNYVSARIPLTMSLADSDGGIYYYPGSGTGTPPYSGGGSSGAPPVTDPNVQMANYINSLPNCSTYHTWLQSLFGDNDMCTNKYESRRRVKAKAYNYNYYLVYNLGVKVKHQYRGWTGLWRKENVDEIRLGVVGATFYYDYSGSFNPAPGNNRITTIYNNNNRYMFDANVFWTQSSYYPGIYTMTGFSTQGYPRIFKDNYYISDILPFSSNNSLIDQGLYSALQAGDKALAYSKLDKLFWDHVMKNVGNFASSLGQSKPDNNITYSYNAVPLGKLLVKKTSYEHQYNADDVQKTYDWGFQIGFTIDSNGDVNPSTNPGALKKPQEFKVLMYGIVKRNGQWHGIKMNTTPNI